MKKGGFLILLVLSFFLSGFVIELQPQTVIEEEASSKMAAQINNRGVWQYKEGKFSEALANFVGASEMDATLWQPHYNCAVALVAMRRPNEALYHLGLSKEIDPLNPVTLKFYTSLLQKVNRSL